jgi:alanine racemase
MPNTAGEASGASAEAAAAPTAGAGAGARDRDHEAPSLAEERAPAAGVSPAAASDDRGYRAVWAEVDLAAIRENVRTLVARAAPAQVMAVVKADGYGHGAVPAARAVLEAGASWLGVALVEEAVELRAAGIDRPIMLLSEPPAESAGAVVRHRLTPVVYTLAGIEALAKAVVAGGSSDPLPVHLKIDTGMNRVGCEEAAAPALAESIAHHDELRLEGVLTHLAVADEPDDPYTGEQLDRFDDALATLRSAGAEFELVHAANSAGLIVAGARARYDLVRTGIAVYGVAPAPPLKDEIELRPALALKARVSFVKELEAGERLSYGLRYTMARRGTVATVPVGYADGVPRNLAHVGGEVLLGGRRCPIAGTVTMDQLMVDAGDLAVEPGDEVVLIGRQGGAEITADEWAERLGTIGYEIVCGIGRRVPRHYV